MTTLTLTVLDDVECMHAPALHTMSYLQDSNGWAVPVATAHDVADYARRAQANDRNGSYGTVTVGADERLSWSIGDDEPMSWAPIGMTSRGLVYALDGLCWHRLSDLLDADAPSGRK